MMKGKFLGTLAILAALATAVFTGCDSPTGNEPEPITFTVTFDSAGGSAVQAQTGLEFGATATAPTPPTRAWHPAAGLWLSSDWDELPETPMFTFGGWRHGNETWNFATDTVTENITLTAHWTAPTVEVSPIEEVEANDVAAAVAHANANPGAFVLAIDASVESGQNLMRDGNTNLTIVGLGQPREIRFVTGSNSQRLFDVGPATGADATISLTLGSNVTLVGRDGNTNDLVRVWNGARLYMYGNSRITGHRNGREGGADGSGAAVQVRYGGAFTMRGGIIIGNRSTNTAGARTALGGGVNVHNTSIFNMEGGEIAGNYRYGNIPSDLVFSGAGIATLSGSAAVARLVINGYASHVSIGSDWTGNVRHVDLRYGTGASGATGIVVDRWTSAANNTVLTAADQALPSGVLGRFGSESRRFIASTEANSRSFGAGYEIVIEGVAGVLREAGAN